MYTLNEKRKKSYMYITQYLPASKISSGILTPEHTCKIGGGFAPAPITSNNVNKVNQSCPVCILAAFVRNKSCNPYAICLAILCTTDGFIISSIRKEVKTCGAISSRRKSLIASRNNPTTALSTKNVCSLALTTKLYIWSLIPCHTKLTRSLQQKIGDK